MATLPDPTAPYKKQANKSGYPFQMAVERRLRDTSDAHDWRVLGVEVPWAAGFVDLVLECDPYLAIVECKRFEDSTLLFLVPRGSTDSVKRCQLEYFDDPEKSPIANGFSPRLMYSDMTISMGSFESQYCIVPKDKAGGPLESICRELAHAGREIATRWSAGVNRAIVIPIIVTNADIAVCSFDASAVSLETGHIAEADAASVGVVRFRKGFESASTAKPRREPRFTKSLSAEMERTIFVVNATRLESFLKDFRIVNHSL